MPESLYYLQTDWRINPTMDVERIYAELGSPGRYQVCVYFLLGLNIFPVIMNHLVMAFYGVKVSF